MFRPSALDTCSAVLVVASSLACSAPFDVDETSRPVVYGTDDRLDYYEHPSELFKRITRESIVALVPADRLDESNPSNIRFRTNTLGASLDLCPDQRFRDNPTAASCSGTLIDTDLVLTAGHCVTSLAACQSYRFVFDYLYESEGQLANVEASDVYRCRQVVTGESRGRVDYGIIQLDRPVDSSRKPAVFRPGDTAMPLGGSVTVVGFGSGIPAKIDTGGVVLENRASELDYFLASTDTFGGHSGSGVFDEAGALVGILVRGETDYVQRGSCNVVNVIGSGGGEGVTYAARARDALCQAWQTDVCGDTGGLCRACGGDDLCPMGWSCESAPGDPGVTWCAKPCTGNTDCGPGHVCDGNRGCTPDVEPHCYDGDIWDFDVCGRRVGVAQRCAAEEVCENDACTSGAMGNACDSPVVIPMQNQTLMGELGAQFTHVYEGSCGGSGRDRVYQMNVDRPIVLTAQAVGFDTVLYLRNDCTEAFAELACNDDATPPGRRGSAIEATLMPGPHFLFLDSFGGRTRNFELEITVTELGPPPDAGVMMPPLPPDAGQVADTGAAPDATVIDKSLDTAEPSSGCGCTTQRAGEHGPGSPSSPKSPGWLAGFVLVIAALIRR